MQPQSTLAHGGDVVAAALEAHGVRFVFTLCGGHISPILTASKARGLRVIDVRDEATAVFAADAVARLTGVPGVAAVTAGPGLTNTITALKNAQLAQSPVILLGGAAATALQGRGALQDIDQRSLTAPHVKRCTKVRRLRDLGPAVEEAFAVAREGVPGPVFIECPVDLLYDEASIRRWYAEGAGKGTALADRLRRFYIHRHVERLFAGSAVTAPLAVGPVLPPRVSNGSLRKAVAALSRAERPLLVVGSQALARAADAPQIAAAVASLGIPVYLSGMARGLLGRDHALHLRHQRRQALREADCVVLAGVPCDFRLDYGRDVRRSATLIAANRSAKEARTNRRPNVAAIGDVGLFLQLLVNSLGQAGRRWSSWIELLRIRDSERETAIEEQARREGEWVNPIAFLRMLDSLAGDNAVMVADGGDFVATASYIVHARAPLSWLDPGVFGTLGVGAGFALGAALCHPERETWILYGDGACGYSLIEFDTFARHAIPVIAVVGNDGGWSQIAREQVKMLHDDVATVLGRSAYHMAVAGLEAEGILVKQTAEVPMALTRARELARTGKPVLVNVWLDKTDFREGSISM
ncbi:MAG: thiamine pyrophosphate-binding protein [Terriglobia bacterium]|jgi:acetolactate synthase-1/2/3 large subunit